MTARSVTHSTFVIERKYAASPARVFAAWADPAIKSRWFSSPEEWKDGKYQLDFRVGGSEQASGGPPGGPVFSYDARYQDIVPDERFVTTYVMHMDDKRISVSVATVELKPDGNGTLLVLTEQGAFLDGYDNAGERERGTRQLLDALDRELQSAPNA